MCEYIFISYKSEQRNIALQIKKILEDNGISCWMAPESIPGGATYASEINKAINGCNEFVIILSEMAQGSQHVLKELDIATKRNKTILPFMIEDFVFNGNVDYYLTNVQLYTAYQSWEDAVEKLVREIRWRLASINVSQSPDSIVYDPIKIGSSLPHFLECGYILFGRYEIKKLLGIYAASQQHYSAVDMHTHREVLVNYVDRTVSHEEPHFGVSYSGTLFQHPYIASPTDEYSNEAYYVRIEPFYNVESLSRLIMMNGPQHYNDVIKWAVAVCEAMIYLNDDKGYIYGQMTPVNIRIQKSGLPILFDTSIAAPINSKYYGTFNEYVCSPEIYMENCVAKPSIDIYALGVNMYFALTGELKLLCSENKSEIKRSLQVRNIPKGLIITISRCLDTKNPYSNFHQVLADLANATEKPRNGFFSIFLGNKK